jgi:hypothetical protein
MNALPTRTGNSDLSDEELLLFDMLFDSNATAAQMSSTNYPCHMNCGYNHSLSDADLSCTIDSLLSRNLIRLIGNSSDSTAPIYSLTESGGERWEVERRPDWNRYVTTLQSGPGTHLMGSIVALCVEEAAGRKCLGAMFAAGRITPNGLIRCRWTCDKRILPWKTFFFDLCLALSNN